MSNYVAERERVRAMRAATAEGRAVRKVTRRGWRTWTRIPREPMIYAAQQGDLIKVGTSLDPDGRLIELRKGRGTAIPAQVVAGEITMPWAAPGGREVEQAIHEQLSGSRVGNTEWFRVTLDQVGQAYKSQTDQTP